MTTNQETNKSNFILSHPIYKIPVIWFLVVIALVFSGWIGEILQNKFGLENVTRFAIQAIFMSGIVVPLIWYYRTRIDKGLPKSIGVGNIRQATSKFLLGFGFIAVPIIITISSVELFGWGSVNFNTGDNLLKTLSIGILTAFFFEALPEELAFRGYLYSHLNVHFKRWMSALFTIGLFVLAPITVTGIAYYLLGMEISLGGANTITGSYIITMFIFGTFMQYLRILTKSVWTGIGFHLMFVYINRIIGPGDNNIIQIKDITSETPMQIVLLGSIVIIFIALILYPIVTKNKIGWNETKS